MSARATICVLAAMTLGLGVVSMSNAPTYLLGRWNGTPACMLWVWLGSVTATGTGIVCLLWLGVRARSWFAFTASVLLVVLLGMMSRDRRPIESFHSGFDAWAVGRFADWSPQQLPSLGNAFARASSTPLVAASPVERPSWVAKAAPDGVDISPGHGVVLSYLGNASASPRAIYLGQGSPVGLWGDVIGLTVWHHPLPCVWTAVREFP